MCHADVEGLGGVAHLESHGAHPEAMRGREAAAGCVVERGDRGRGGIRVCGGRIGGGEGGGIGGGEEELELAGAEEVGGVVEVSGGEVGFEGYGHAEAPGEATGGVGGVGAPELDVVEPADGEAVGFWVRPDEVVEAHQLEVGASGGGAVWRVGGGGFLAH